MNTGHGGNILIASKTHKIPADRILDFSSNINPFNPPKIRSILARGHRLINSYPDPQCSNAIEALSKQLNIPKENILLGNGSNELIYLLPKALESAAALIFCPSFSEYELSLKLSKARTYFVYGAADNGFEVDFSEIFRHIPKNGLIIIGNPNNPTGSLCKKEDLLNLAQACQKNSTFLLIDEVFMEFVDNNHKISLIKEALILKNLIVLRSLTKFFALAGLRIGYLVTNRELIEKIKLFQPCWSLNCFAQQAVCPKLFDARFMNKSFNYLRKEKQFLFKGLKSIKGILPFFPAANFILCEIQNPMCDSKMISERLIKNNILIRDCANFRGLNNRYFRAAVKKRKDNICLLRALSKILQ